MISPICFRLMNHVQNIDGVDSHLVTLHRILLSEKSYKSPQHRMDSVFPSGHEKGTPYSVSL